MLQTAFERDYFPPTGTPWPPLRWRGVPCQKLATDLWAMQELVWDVRPGLIIETGTAAGGTALFLADLLDRLGQGYVLTMDVQPWALGHPRIVYRQGSSTDPALIAAAEDEAALVQRLGHPVLVVLDSDHRAPHVAGELAAYAPLVTVGSFMIIEDMNLGRSVMLEHGPGPATAVEAFLAAHPQTWAVDWEREPNITTNSGGYLRRLGECP